MTDISHSKFLGPEAFSRATIEPVGRRDFGKVILAIAAGVVLDVAGCGKQNAEEKPVENPTIKLHEIADKIKPPAEPILQELSLEFEPGKRKLTQECKNRIKKFLAEKFGFQEEELYINDHSGTTLIGAEEKVLLMISIYAESGNHYTARLLNDGIKRSSEDEAIEKREGEEIHRVRTLIKRRDPSFGGGTAYGEGGVTWRKRSCSEYYDETLVKKEPAKTMRHTEPYEKLRVFKSKDGTPILAYDYLTKTYYPDDESLKTKINEAYKRSRLYMIEDIIDY